MSVIVTTKLGRFRLVNTGDQNHPDTWLFECPGCGQWAYLDQDQWAGRISVDHASEGCSGRYHETHNFSAELVATMQARLLTGSKPHDNEEADASPKEPR